MFKFPPLSIKASTPEVSGWLEEMFRLAWWFKLLLAVIVVQAFVLLIVVWLAITDKSEIRTLIVRSSEQGQFEYAGWAKGLKMPPLKRAEIEYVLSNLTSWWRRMHTDLQYKKEQYARLWYHLSPSASEKLKDIINTGNLLTNVEVPFDPLEHASNFNSTINIISINQLGQSSWQVRWHEVIRTNNDGSKVDEFTGIVTYNVGRRSPDSAKYARNNPFGIVVLDLDASKER